MPRRPTRCPRARDWTLLAVGLLALVVGLAPLLPDAGRTDEALAPAADQRATRAVATAGTAGMGRLTPALRAEVERVVDLGRSEGRLIGRATVRALVDSQLRCALFEGQRYCLGFGWTQRTQSEVRAHLAAAGQDLATRRTPVETTGDLGVLATLRRAAARTPEARATAERAELTLAARSVAKVWLIRHQVLGEPLPTGFLEAHPEARPITTTTTAELPRRRPGRFTLMKGARTNEQSRSYWCGPATMQMLAWGWQKDRRPQRHWARRLGTTTDGTAITEIARLINRTTGYDSVNRAGPYIVLDISGFDFRQWMRLAKRHLVDYRAPLVLHPVLLERFFPYLDDDASGHFQVGRGYQSKPGKTKQISFFEPWNQQAFDPSEPFVERVQWRNAYRSYRANLTHFQQNIGV